MRLTDTSEVEAAQAVVARNRSALRRGGVARIATASVPGSHQATGAALDRYAIHEVPKARIAARLRALGISVARGNLQQGYDFVLDGRLRVAVRSALRAIYVRRWRVHHRQYTYRYPVWHFNFHHRGRLEKRYCDVFICVPLGAGPLELDAAFVIPWEARTAKSFTLHASRRSPYGGKYAAYRGAWVPLRELLRQARCPDPAACRRSSPEHRQSRQG